MDIEPRLNDVKETISSPIPACALALTLKNLPRQAEAKGIGSFLELRFDFFFNILEIYLSCESSHHGGAARRVHG